MKRGTLLLTVLAGLLVFLAVLALYLPASWFASLLPAQAKCAELGGSIWHGECLGLIVENNKLGDASWNFAPGNALGGQATEVRVYAPGTLAPQVNPHDWNG